MKYTVLSLDQRLKVLEAITGGVALAWFMSCLLSWIIQTTSLTEIATPFPTSTLILLVFLAFCSFFALTLSRALKEGLFGLYILSSFNAFWVVFIIISNIFGLSAVTNFFFNGGISCLIQVMVTYTTAIFTLAETGILNLNRSAFLVFGTTPFFAALLFLIGTYLIEDLGIRIGLSNIQLLWIILIITAVTIASISYALRASSGK